MGVNDSDKVVIVTDQHTREVADAIHIVAKSITNSRIFVLEDYTLRPMKELPAEIIKAIPDATVTFWMAQSYEGELKVRSFFRTEALKYARHAHMPGVTKEMMEQGMCADYNLVYKTTMKIYDTVKNVGNMHVTSSDGTSLDLEFSKNWRWIPSHGIFHEKGTWGNLPDGEVFTTPYNVNGIMIVSELGDWFAKKYGYLQDRIRFEISNSRIDLGSVQCSNSELKRELLKYLETDGNSNRASEFAIPTNLHLMNMPLIGNMLQDEKARVHIAFGDPYGSQTNANWQSSTHIDCILENCDVTTGTIKIMKAGKLLTD
jgi:leucyl aminopeptidase (aminopeptidase T)